MTEKQLAFARAYARLRSATQAAKEAGYKGNASGDKLMKNPEVLAEIARLQQAITERADKTDVDVVNAFANIAFMDLAHYYKPDEWYDGELILKAPDELTPEQRQAIIDMRYVRKEHKIDGRKEYRQEWRYTYASKEGALNQMGRHFGIFDDKLRLTSGNRANPFANATPEQLTKLKQNIIETMTGGNVVDGEVVEAQNRLSNGQGH